jgi:hypothetical protein
MKDFENFFIIINNNLKKIKKEILKYFDKDKFII